jgi:hypothetical protein
MNTKICIVCGNRFDRGRDDNICCHCTPRVKTWGLRGAKKLIEIARKNENISIDDAKAFCKENYIGRCGRSFVKVHVFRRALEVLGSTAKVIGRHRMYDDYEYDKRANTAFLKRNFPKKEECEICGSKEELHLHHIVPCFWGGHEFAPTEIITVCKTCHLVLHERLKKVLTNEFRITLLRPYREEIIKRARSVIL